MAEQVITSGVVGGPLVSRVEIRTFAKDQDVMNLYLLALERFQNVDQKSPHSWFQIAGIHGRPYVAYAGAGGSGNMGGYCTHSSILFPPWHRPYLALFEQHLAKHVTDIANEFPADKRQRYQQAAQRFRIPYWDWADNADLPDFVSRQATVSVIAPSGQKTINNPLYSYTFKPMYSNFGDGLPEEKMWESWQSTVRWPSATNATGKSQPEAMERNLANNRLTLRDRTYNLLTQASTYEAFSNDGWLGPRADPRAFDSLESVHGQIHGMCGRNGHMAAVDYAAFDPVFWLHHCNIDRLFAMWQALNPDQYVVPKVNEAGTFASPQGTVENVNTPLQPFWQKAGVFWTSAGVRDTRSLNYTYPELVKWSTLTAQQKSTRLRSDINGIYGRTAPIAAIVPELFNASTQPGAPLQSIVGQAPAGSKAAPVPISQAVAAQKPVAAAKASAPAVPPPAAQNTLAGTVASGAAKATAAISAAVPAPVAKAAATAAGTVAAGAQKVAAAAPAPVQQAAATVASTAPAGAQKVAAVAGLGAHQHDEHVEVTGVDRNAHVDDNRHYHEWIANITVEKYAAKKTFFVYIFLGDFNTDPSKWGEDTNLVGTHVVFANNMQFTGCERCRDAAEKHKLVTGTIPLTGALGDRLGARKVGHLDPEEVVPYLTKNLHWRVQDQDDHEIHRRDMPSLKISVAHSTVLAPTNVAEFPVWQETTKQASITTGREGGATEND